MTRNTLQRLFTRLLPSLLLTFLCACDGASSGASQVVNEPGQTAGWPRSIAGSHAEIRLQGPPQRIVSTSVTLTGTLLTINAPVLASGASQANSSVTDSHGFFRQWSAVAAARGVIPLYQGEADAEAVAAMAPDLIIVAGSGGDSALRLYEQLQLIAPTLVVNYDDKSWQELALLLGHASGHEADAQRVIAEFAGEVARTRQRLVLPAQPSSALTYYEDGSGANLWTAASAQGQLLSALGFTLATVPEAVKGQVSQGLRKDIIQLSGEHFASGLQGQSLLLFSAEQDSVKRLLANPFLASLPAVQQRQVYATGLDSFRLDYYSSLNLLARLREHFGRP